MSEDRWLCGCRVRSEAPLPELLPWRGDDREPDVHVVLQPDDAFGVRAREDLGSSPAPEDQPGLAGAGVTAPAYPSASR